MNDRSSKQSCEVLYEVVGINDEQARQVAELLAGGAVLWRLGHTWISDRCVVRPQGCKCRHCAPIETPPVPSNLRLSEDRLRALAPRETQPVASNQNVWCLTDEKINSLQVESIDSLVRRCKAAHYVNVIVRINGKDEVFEADWLKHLRRELPPVETPNATKAKLLSEALDMCEGWAAHVGGNGVANHMPVHVQTIEALRQWREELLAEPMLGVGEPIRQDETTDARDAARYRIVRVSKLTGDVLSHELDTACDALIAARPAVEPEERQCDHPRETTQPTTDRPPPPRSQIAPPTSKTEVERMQEARDFVSGWLFRSKDRRSSGQSWSLEQCHDAARMLVEFRQSSTVETTQPTTACRHDWVSNIGGIRCVSCGAQIAGRCLPEEPSEMSELQRLRNGIRALQSTCCGETNDLCHGCRALLALLKSPEETIARPPNYNAFHAFEKRLEAAVRPEEPEERQCDHPRSELLARKGNQFEMRKNIFRVRLRSPQGECPTGDYEQAEAIEPQGSRSESPAPSPEKAAAARAVVVSSVCGKPMPEGKGAGRCINVPGHEGECDDMPI